MIDGPRCIAYLTIEHQGAIPEHLRSLIGTWIFGCDVCQEACPINKRLAPTPLERGDATTARGPVPYPDLVECLELTQQEFEMRFAYTPVWRTGREGLARNAAIALGNAGDTEAIPALETAIQSDPDLVVREAAAWSLAKLKSSRVPGDVRTGGDTSRLSSSSSNGTENAVRENDQGKREGIL